ANHPHARPPGHGAARRPHGRRAPLPPRAAAGARRLAAAGRAGALRGAGLHLAAPGPERI
nr:hypothetical protein [Tanacetum cinerariifolium]